jgi:hypothetical protein
MFVLLALSIVALPMGGRAWGQAEEVFVPSLVYRTGTYAPSGVPFANGMWDYLTMLNERDGGIGGVKIAVEECETGYDTKKGLECWDTVKANATKVIVHHPAASAPVHGLLVFCSVPPNNEPQGQLHTLKISADRIPQTATMESVVWDDVAYDWTYRDDAGGVSEVSSWPTWILWMSQQPF